MDTNQAAFVGSIPDFYDRGLGPVLFADYAAAMAQRVAAVAPRRVLETAAGTGIVTRALRDALAPDATLTATDLNLPMLEVARGKFAAGDRTSFAVADAQALAYPDGAFDAVVCQFGIMFYPDRPKSYRETLRVLSPGGTYFFSVWDSHAFNSFAGITDALVKRTFPDDPPGFYRVPFSCAAIDPIKQDLIDAGFTGIRIEVLPIAKRVDDLGLFASGLIFGNPLVDQIRARGKVAPEVIQAELVDLLARQFGSAPAVIPLQTILYSAITPR